MAKTPPAKRVVAELGRPETDEETAARKAEQSRLYRDRKTLNNLLYALLVSVALVAVIFFLVPRSDESLLETVDYGAVAASAQNSMPVPLAVPALPEEWTSNAAELRSGANDGVSSWYVGLISPGDQYVGLTQGVDANPTWLAAQVQNGAAAGVTTIDGVEWTIYDNRSAGRTGGNVEYALTAEAGRSTFVVFGTASDDEVQTVAASIADDVLAQSTSSDPAEEGTL